MHQGRDLRVAKTLKKVDRWLQLGPTYDTSPLHLYIYSSVCSPPDPLLQKQGSRTQDASSSSLPIYSPDIDLEAVGDIPLIGMFMHGGGYCHMSADEKSPTSKIPRRLTKVRTTRGLAVRLRNRLFIILPGFPGWQVH